MYVDQMTAWPKCGTQQFPYKRSCHLAADTVEELHGFAQALGLRREWFQDHKDLPHSDMTETKRRLAVQRGAIQITRRQLVALIQKGRAARLAQEGKP